MSDSLQEQVFGWHTGSSGHVTGWPDSWLNFTAIWPLTPYKEGILERSGPAGCENCPVCDQGTMSILIWLMPRLGDPAVGVQV